MTGDALLAWLALITIALLLAALCDGLGRRWSAATRHAIWRGAILLAITVPVVRAFAPAWRVLPAPASSTPLMVASPTGASMDALSAGPATNAPQATTPRVTTRPATWSSMPPAWFGIVWGAGTVLVLLRLLAGLAHRRRLLRRAISAPLRLQRAVAQAARQLHVRRPIILRITVDDTTPCTFGLWRPTVIMPQSAESWSAERLDNVVRHEVAHIRRGDTAMALIAQLLQAVLWWHPLCTIARRRLYALAETACDDLVLAGGARPSAYAADLLTIATGRALPSAIALATHSTISQRIEGVLDATRVRSSLGARAPQRCTAALLLLSLPLGSAQPRATENAPTVASTPAPVVETTTSSSTVLPPTPRAQASRKRSPRNADVLLRHVQRAELQFAYAERTQLLVAALRQWQDTPKQRDILLDQLSALPASGDRATVIAAALRLPAGSRTARAMLPEIRAIPAPALRAELLLRAARRSDLRAEDTALDWLAARALSERTSRSLAPRAAIRTDSERRPRVLNPNRGRTRTR
jgi:beta-lactamase regulating signal transducer with metallopeptidase domain